MEFGLRSVGSARSRFQVRLRRGTLRSWKQKGKIDLSQEWHVVKAHHRQQGPVESMHFEEAINDDPSYPRAIHLSQYSRATEVLLTKE